MDSKTIILAAGLMGALALPASATAQEASMGMTSPVQPTFELTTRLTERLDIRFGLNHLDDRQLFAWSGDPSNDLLGLSASALIDWQFASDGLRVTGGALYGDLGNTSRDWNGRSYSGDRLSWWNTDNADLTPYIGLGWDRELGEEGQLGFQFDMGVMFDSFGGGQGSESSTTAPASAEEEALLRKEFESFRYTPMISAGVQYRF